MSYDINLIAKLELLFEMRNWNEIDTLIKTSSAIATEVLIIYSRLNYSNLSYLDNLLLHGANLVCFKHLPYQNAKQSNNTELINRIYDLTSQRDKDEYPNIFN